MTAYFHDGRACRPIELTEEYGSQLAGTVAGPPCVVRGRELRRLTPRGFTLAVRWHMDHTQVFGRVLEKRCCSITLDVDLAPRRPTNRGFGTGGRGGGFGATGIMGALAEVDRDRALWTRNDGQSAWFALYRARAACEQEGSQFSFPSRSCDDDYSRLIMSDVEAEIAERRDRWRELRGQ